MGFGEKVQRGDDLNISADSWNQFTDTAKLVEQDQKLRSGPISAQPLPPGQVLVQVDSNAVRPHGIIGIDGVVVQPITATTIFGAPVILKGVKPDPDGSFTGRFLIASHNIPANSVGRAFAWGVTPVRLNIIDSSHKFADVSPAPLEGIALNTSTFGGAEILWKESGDFGVKWGVVRLGGGTGGGGILIPVNMTKTGGLNGDASTAATFTYQITDPFTGNILKSGVNPTFAPHRWRRSLGRMVVADFGYAHFVSGDPVIGWCNEVYIHSVCAS